MPDQKRKRKQLQEFEPWQQTVSPNHLDTKEDEELDVCVYSKPITLMQVQEIKVNFETELTTVQSLMEAQQLNLQVRFGLFKRVVV